MTDQQTERLYLFIMMNLDKVSDELIVKLIEEN